jgi:hypothetical protein
MRSRGCDGIEIASGRDVSNHFAIAGVTSTLRNLLRDRLQTGAGVTAAPPDVTVSGVTGKRLNIYLYHLAENASLKNQQIMGQGHPGEYGRPPLSLNLHYLLTAFGGSEELPDADLQAQQVLADAMRVLHDFPVIPEDLHEHDDPLRPLILDPSLLNEAERLKITLSPTSLEEFSKIWVALPAACFRRSVAYEVSVVQIESERARRASLPVRRRQVQAVPFNTPFIAEIARDVPFEGIALAVAEPGDTIVLTGRNLAGRNATRVRVGTLDTVVASPQAERLELALPAGLTAGVQPVQVIHDLLLPAQPGPPVAHRGFESNLVPLVVLPRLLGLTPSPATAGTLVTATVDPPVLARQQRTLLLGDFSVRGEEVAPDAPPSTTITFRLPSAPAALPAGNYLVRVRIDGAESRLQTNAVTQLYDGPILVVT